MSLDAAKRQSAEDDWSKEGERVASIALSLARGGRLPRLQMYQRPRPQSRHEPTESHCYLIARQDVIQQSGTKVINGLAVSSDLMFFLWGNATDKRNFERPKRFSRAREVFEVVRSLPTSQGSTLFTSLDSLQMYARLHPGLLSLLRQSTSL
jgi:hypothetical protein